MNPHLCLHCDFKWSRPYQYRIHLKKRHPDVDPDGVLGKSAESRRRSAIIGRDLPLPPPIEPGRQSRAESRSPTLPRVPPPSVPNVTHDFQPAVTSVAYDHHPEQAELANTMPTHGDAGGLGFQFPGTTDAFLSTEWDQLVNDMNISIPVGQKWLA